MGLTLLAGPANAGKVELLLDRYLERLADEPLLEAVTAQAHANPSRTGCPSSRVLLGLATRDCPLSDPAWDHVLHCHPCTVEIRTLRRAQQPPLS